MRKNKTLLSLLALGVLSSSMLAGCDQSNNPTSEVSEDDKNQQAAEEVIAKINALTETSSEADVVAVRTAFDGLTDAQKALVTNLAKLEKQEKRVAGEKAVKAVVDAISALNDSSTEAEVNDAFTKYVALDDDLKDKVTNVAALMYQKARIDAKDVVDPVVNLINALTSSSTKAEVEAAASAFNALSSDDKQFISDEVVAKLEAQLTRVLQEDIAAVKDFLNTIVVEDLISDASVIEVVRSLNSLDLREEVISGLTSDEQAKLTLLKKTTDSFEYAGENQAKTWFDEGWTDFAYGELTFGQAEHNDEINASVRPFSVEYFVEGDTVHQEFGMTLVGDSSLKSTKEAVFYLYNPDIETTMRVDYAKGTAGSFCAGGNISIKHGWNRVNVGLSDVVEGKNVVNLMVGVFESAGGLTVTEGWKVSSFIKYDDSVTGAIRTEYYRILKVLKAYVALEETERNAFNVAMDEFAKLTAEEKEMLPEGIESKLETDQRAFKEADARALNEILADFPGIADGTNVAEYAVNYLLKLLDFKDQYDTFDDGQKALVTNYSKVSDALEALKSYKLLSDGSQKFNAWDYGPVGGTTTTEDPVHGNVQSITLEDDAQHSITLPANPAYLEFDDILVSIYCPSGHMEVVAEGKYWPFNYGSVSVGWNVVRVPSEVFTTNYPANSIGLFLYGVGEWKFGSIIGFTNEEGAARLVETISGLSFSEHSEAQEKAIKDARVAYDALGAISKTLVSNYDTLLALEEEVETYYVNRVIEAIDALAFDEDGTTQDAQKAAIEAARAMYEALNETQKAGVTNINKLLELEAEVERYYYDVLLAELEEKANSVEEIKNSTAFDVALATLNKANVIKANDLYSVISNEAQAKVEAAITSFNSIYTKLSDTMTGIAGSPTITKKVDPTYGPVNSVVGSDTNVQAVFGNADFAEYDVLYVLAKSEVSAGFNLWGSSWTTDVQTFNLVENTWTVLQIKPSTFFTTSLDVLDFCLSELTNNHEFLISGVYGHIPFKAPFIGEDDTVVYNGCGINSKLNDWASFTGTGEDDAYGAYTIVDIEAAGATSFDVIVNGTGGLEAGKYSLVKFAVYNPTTVTVGLHAFMSNSGWAELSNQFLGNIAPGWNELKIDAKLLENATTHFITLRFNFTNGGNANGWRISKFYASPISLVKTSYHFGQVSDSGEIHNVYGTIYNLIQEQYFIDQVDTGTLASASTGVFRAQLPEGKTAFEFAMYNPTDSDISFHIAGGDPWTDGPFTTLKAKQWTVITITAVDITINDSGTVYFYMSSSNASGWKITDIWAK